MKPPLAIIPTYMTKRDDLLLTLDAVNSLLSTSNCDLMVVDDGSPSKSCVEELEEYVIDLGQRTIVKFENTGFSSTVNCGLRTALHESRDALLVNADIQFIDPGWLDRMLASEGDVIGAMLIYPNGLIQHAGVFYSLLYNWFDHRYRFAPGLLEDALRPRICPVTAALQLIRHETLVKVGIYDEEFRLSFEDMDYCLRVFQAGLKCVYEPTVRAVHHESIFRRKASAKHLAWQEDGYALLNRKHDPRDFTRYASTMLIDD